jgi:hypothetical protein
MSKPYDLRAQDPIIKKLKFKPFRYKQERQAVQFLPEPGKAQTMSIITPWGGELIVERGDYIVNELDSPENRWPVKKDIFEATYIQVRPGVCIKRALVHLYPLWEFTKDLEQLVRVHTQEGVVTVRAGDFYLAKGVKNEIWPMPKEKVESTLYLVETKG